MNTARSFAVIAFVGFLAQSGTQVAFGQKAPAPAAQPAPAAAAQPAADVPVPAAAPLPADLTPAQPLPAAPDAGAAAQPLPPAQPDPAAAPAAAAQPLPAAAVQPVPAVAAPAAAVPNLALVSSSRIIGSRAILVGGISIGRVQDLFSIAGSGEYVLVANPSGFVTIPRSLTIFDPVSRILQVNMTFAQVAELPRLLRIAQLNRQFLGRVLGFFRTQRGEAILQNGIARNGRFTRLVAERRAETRPVGPVRRAETRPPGGADRRADTRTATKPVNRPQPRTEPRAENATEPRR